jgi:aminoglycoside phosphotransferase family enzyme
MMAPASHEGPGLEDELAQLLRPATYEAHLEGVERVERVDGIETHMSWVFLTETRVYKLKKPVRTRFLDYGTLAARRRCCLAEVQLNRRLAARVYLGVVGLMRAPDGTLRIGGEGTVVDWLVEMQRLPADRMLDVQIRRGTIDAGVLRRAAEALATFYRGAEPAGWSADEYHRRLQATVLHTRDELRRPRYRLPAGSIDAVAEAQLAMLTRHSSLLAARAGRVVDAHGDLRPEHVCLVPEPVIIDCLEFDRDLRLLDPLSELAFLRLECERLGAPAVGAAFLDVYAEVTGDRAAPELMAFYRGHHAGLRAMIAAWHLDDSAIDAHEKWRARARHYLQLAAQP